MTLYFPTIKLITPPAEWSERKKRLYQFVRLSSRLPRTEPAFYTKLGALYPRRMPKDRMVLVLPNERADTEVGCG